MTGAQSDCWLPRWRAMDGLKRAEGAVWPCCAEVMGLYRDFFRGAAPLQARFCVVGGTARAAEGNGDRRTVHRVLVRRPFFVSYVLWGR